MQPLDLSVLVSHMVVSGFVGFIGKPLNKQRRLALGGGASLACRRCGFGIGGAIDLKLIAFFKMHNLIITACVKMSILHFYM